jgi:5-methyltetrahydropteroyltriglutamate--homocysteine methyltransferase
MYKATDGVALPTSVIGSLPRPQWYTENLGRRSFIEAMVNSAYREQYTDAVSCFIRDQETAGLDLVTDGDAHYDVEVGGHSWISYPVGRMNGYENEYRPAQAAAIQQKRGHILHDGGESRLNPTIVGPVSRGALQYTALWKVAQRLTPKPVKFGTITPEFIALAARDQHYKSRRDRIMAVSDALNAELHELADAGCAAIQMEEPLLHLPGPRGEGPDEIGPDFMVQVFNNTVRGLRAKTEIWCHSCWGNPSQQRLTPKPTSYAPVLKYYDQCDCDVVTFETAHAGGMDLEAYGTGISSNKKVAIGVIDHHTLQVERPDEVADLIRRALKHIPKERLVITSDCGMGREGMARRHAFYKMVAMVQGTNAVKRELGLPEAPCLAADPRYSLTEGKTN